MKKSLVIGLALLVTLGAGFALGIWVRRGNEIDAPQTETAPAKAARLQEELRSALAKWQYPGALPAADSHSMGAALVPDGRVTPAGHYAVWATAVDYPKVLDYYANELSFSPIDPELAHMPKQVVQDWPEVGTKLVLVDMREPNKPASSPKQSRNVRVHCLVRRTWAYDAMVFLSRGKGEEHTHIIVVYHPR